MRTGLRMVQPNPEWSVAIPVRDPKTGAVLGTIETSAHRRPRLRGLSRPALILSLLLVMFAFTAAILARRISRPVERLTEAARRLGAGDLAARVPPGRAGRWWGRRDSSSDELADLTRAFNDMAERIERLIAGQKELMANISHELRSPLTRIRVALELLPRNGATRARLADVEADLDELERLIEDVLTASRLEATGLPPHPELVEAQRLLEDLAERARLRSAPRARFACAWLQAVPWSSKRIRRCSGARLWNLVDNAAKYGAPPVALSAQRHNGTVELSVSDEGPGIPHESASACSRPSIRWTARGRRVGPRAAFGLGLTLASRVAQVHHGVITIGPAETVNGAERGCRVTLTLPASPEASPPHARQHERGRRAIKADLKRRPAMTRWAAMMSMILVLASANIVQSQSAMTGQSSPAESEWRPAGPSPPGHPWLDSIRASSRIPAFARRSGLRQSARLRQFTESPEIRPSLHSTGLARPARFLLWRGFATNRIFFVGAARSRRSRDWYYYPPPSSAPSQYWSYCRDPRGITRTCRTAQEDGYPWCRRRPPPSRSRNLRGELGRGHSRAARALPDGLWSRRVPRDGSGVTALAMTPRDSAAPVRVAGLELLQQSSPRR